MKADRDLKKHLVNATSVFSVGRRLDDGDGYELSPKRKLTTCRWTPPQPQVLMYCAVRPCAVLGGGGIIVMSVYISILSTTLTPSEN